MADKHPIRGVLAGVAGGLIAGWVMNQWSEGPGAKLTEQLETPEEKQQIQQQSDGEDATVKTAEKLAETFENRELSKEEKAREGPVVHYAYAALVGGLYGGLAEYSSLVRSGFGTTYGSALFVGGDLVAVPALGLSKPLNAYPASSYAGPFTAHLVYGATTELVRRIVRAIL